MLRIYLNNIALGGFIGLFTLIKTETLLVVGLFTLLLLSFGARILLSQSLPRFSFGHGSNMGKLLLIPLFLYAAIADFIVLAIAMGTASKESRLPTALQILFAALIFLTIYVIFKEAVIAFSNKPKKQYSKPLMIACRIVLILYSALAVSLIWTYLGDKLIFTWKDEDITKKIFNAFLFYLVIILPFERQMILEKVRTGKSFAHLFLSLIIGFGCVLWTIIG